MYFQPNSLSIPYCQQKPRNTELNGLFQCQFQGVDPKKFADGSTVGAPGTIPLGQNAAVNPPGSCPANPSGPVPAGQQLVDLVPGGSGAGNSTTQNSSSALSSASGAGTQATSSSASVSATVSAAQVTPSSAASGTKTPISPTPRAVSNSSASGSGSGFKAQNGKDAQSLNTKFQSLTADSPCTGKL